MEIFENAIIGLNKRFDDLEQLHKRTLHVQYEIGRFKRKRKAEAQIKKLLKYKIIPILEKIDLKKFNIWYEKNEDFKKAVKKMKKAIDALDEWYL